jgi:hypothetical protein
MSAKQEKAGMISQMTEAEVAGQRAIAMTNVLEEMDEHFKAIEKIDPLKAKFSELVEQGVIEEVRPNVYKPTGG